MNEKRQRIFVHYSLKDRKNYIDDSMQVFGFELCQNIRYVHWTFNLSFRIKGIVRVLNCNVYAGYTDLVLFWHVSPSSSPTAVTWCKGESRIYTVFAQNDFDYMHIIIHQNRIVQVCYTAVQPVRFGPIIWIYYNIILCACVYLSALYYEGVVPITGVGSQ